MLLYITKNYSKQYILLLAALGPGGQIGSNKIVLLQAQKSRSASDIGGAFTTHTAKKFFLPFPYI